MNAQKWRDCPPMTHEEWLAWRRTGLGSSDAAVIMGVSPWKTLYQLWEEKVYGLTDSFENSSMRRGKELEESARRSFEWDNDVSVFACNIEREAYPWQKASLDGIDLDGEVMVEIKCPGKDDHFLAVTKKVPAKYFPQCQHQLMVTGLPSMFYYSFDGECGATVEVFRDEAYIADMFEKQQAFWDMVLNRTPPELSDKDLVDMNDNADWEYWVSQLREAKNQSKEWEKKEKGAKDILNKMAQGKSAQGHGIRLTKSICPGSIDYKQAIDDYLDNMRSHYPKVLFPEISLEAYRKESFTKWTVRDTKE